MTLFRRRAESRSDLSLLSGINDPSTPIYQALTTGELGGLVMGRDNLPVINMTSAARLSAVLRSVAIIANTIAGLPLTVSDRRPDGSFDPVQDPDEDVIWGTPNPESTPIGFWSTVVGHCVLGGDAFLHVDDDGRGVPRHLWPIHPNRVTVTRTPSDERGMRHKVYVLDGESEPLFDYAEGGSIIHVPNLSLDGLRGLNPIAYMRRTLQLAASAEELGTRVFANGALPGGVLEVEGDLTKDQHDKLLAYWNKRHEGPSHAARIAIVDNGAKFKGTSISLEDAQYLETRRFQVQEVARIFGVPPHLLYETTANTSWGSGLEELTAGFVSFTLSNYSGRFEQALTGQLLWRKPMRRARFDYDALLRGKLLDQLQAAQLGIANGVWSPNEVRRRMGEGPRGDGLGDQYLRQLNTQAAGADPVSMAERYNALGLLIRSGFTVEGALAAVGLPPIEHLGLLPLTLQDPNKLAAEADKAAAEAGAAGA